MIETAQIQEILSLYQKYGWTLKRVLISKALQEKIAGQLAAVFGETEIVSSGIDALWFSRPAKNGGETWELRHLSINPYALLEVFDANDDEDVREEVLMEIEERLKEALSKKKKERH